MSYAARLLPALQALAEELTDAGVPASVDREQNMPIPGAWVRPDTVADLALDGTGRARVSVFLIVPTGGDRETLTGLARLLDRALEVCTPEQEVDTSVLVNINSNALPAFRLVCDIDC